MAEIVTEELKSSHSSEENIKNNEQSKYTEESNLKGRIYKITIQIILDENLVTESKHQEESAKDYGDKTPEFSGYMDKKQI